jgi:hypothetical protein
VDAMPDLDQQLANIARQIRAIDELKGETLEPFFRAYVDLMVEELRDMMDELVVVCHLPRSDYQWWLDWRHAHQGR